MKSQPDAPADTRMMEIVHRALRRDLGRCRQVLATTPAPSDKQQRAIARHVEWMLQFLDNHHRGEDQGLYPMVRERNPAAASLIDAMTAEHDSIVPAMAELQRAAAAVSEVDSARDCERLIAALSDLETTLLPHLRREEDEMMPVVSSTITTGEWRRWDEDNNIKPKSFTELGREGHWLIDGLDPSDREMVVGLVPPVPRFILLHGFAPSYRRHQARCWGPSPRRRVHKHGRAELWVDAPLDDLWQVVIDVTRVGEWSHECVNAHWVDGAIAAAPGARFRGGNRNGIFRWGRLCEIVSAEPTEVVWRTVPTWLYPDSTEWSIKLRDDNGGTKIEQTFHVIRVPELLDRLYATVMPAHRDRTKALTEDLSRLGALAARRLSA